MAATLQKKEFGDFQTPLGLAEQVARSVFEKYSYIRSVVEPTCGKGSFIRAAIKAKKNLVSVYGWEINQEYINLSKSILPENRSTKLHIEKKDFFSINWASLPEDIKRFVLFIGNPPWFTNSESGKIGSTNLPKKENFQNYSGIEAITGKSNFDVSEWMLIKVAEYISGKEAAMSFIIKTSVARKVFAYICSNKMLIKNVEICPIDARKYFDVSVDACLFCAEGTHTASTEYFCSIYDSLSARCPVKTMGYAAGKLIADINTYNSLRDIDAGSEFPWRSGIKHDCAKVMEFKLKDGRLMNGFQEDVDISRDYLYPMYKSSHLAHHILKKPVTYMLVTQKKIGDETDSIKICSPKTWAYLQKYEDKLNSRKSSIYKKSPKFSIFGVGDYSFKHWKVAVSGLYKNVNFKLIGPFQGKPVVLDDTCCMMSFDCKEQADFVCRLLSSDMAANFIDSISFKDSKRPATVAMLNRISLKNLAKYLGEEKKYDFLFKNCSPKQLSLF